MPNQDEFGQLAIQRQVQKLFGGKNFFICDVDNLARLLGVNVNQRIYRQLRPYHCEDFADMSDREKQLLQEKVVEALRGDNILNPARVLSQLTDEGGDFAFTEDRYLNQSKRLS